MNTNGEAVATLGHAANVDLIGGVLCLDFINTVEPRAVARHGGQPREYLTAYEDLIAWSRHAEVLDAAQAQVLLAQAAQHPAAAQTAIEDAVALREVIYRIFYAIADGAEPKPADLDALNMAYGDALGSARLVSVGTTFDWVWLDTDENLERPLWPIVRSAVDLLMHGERVRIKDCATHAAGCGWLFYDTSKNNSRRWCSMRGCGGPEKERRRAARRRAGSDQAR